MELEIIALKEKIELFNISTKMDYYIIMALQDEIILLKSQIHPVCH